MSQRKYEQDCRVSPARKFLDDSTFIKEFFIGNDLNRSVNAAKNILVRGLAGPALSAGESVIAGRASMRKPTAEVSAVRPENRLST